MGEFSDKVYGIVQRIPEGYVATYGLIAKLMGRPQSARYVGFALRNNPAPWQGGSGVPCHRVVFGDGRLCDNFAFGGPDVQRNLLEAEGVTFEVDGRVDLKASLWSGESDAPIATASLDSDFPQSPPDNFDWASELGDY